MITYNVRKRGGRLELYDPEKIVRCCIAAGVPEEEARKIADEISGHIYINIPTSEIRKTVIKKLRETDSKAAEAYEKYEIMGG